VKTTSIDWAHCFGEGTGRTWNVISGCHVGCEWCSSRRQVAKGRGGCQKCRAFAPHYHVERLLEPRRETKQCGIIIAPHADLWGPDVEREWREVIWAECRQARQHQFFVTTKCPQMISYDEAQGIPWNVLVGVSAEDQDTRAWRLRMWRQVFGERQMLVAIEPMLGPVTDMAGVGPQDWVVIGALTGPGSAKQLPPAKRVQRIVKRAKERKCKVWVRDNLAWAYRGVPADAWPQEYPTFYTKQKREEVKDSECSEED
jgi:protein gp37